MSNEELKNIIGEIRNLAINNFNLAAMSDEELQEKIEEMLLKDVEKEGIMEKIRKIEEIVYENRKI